MIDIDVPQSVIATMQGRRVGELIEHPILQQLGVDKRYFKEVRNVGRFMICTVVKRRPK